MPATQWSADAGLIRRLLDEPYRFEFFQAMRLLAGVQPLQRVRLGNRLSMAFPPSDISDAALESDAHDQMAVRLTPAFIGLLGSTGALPLHYSQRIAEHERTAVDGGPRAFLELLAQRSQLLFYMAWARHRPECMAGQAGDSFLRMLTAIAGGAATACARGVCGDNADNADNADNIGAGDYPGAGGAGAGIAAETLARYAMHLRGRTASAPALAAIYSEYFGVPFQLEQLAGAWQPLPPEHQAQLGVANASLDGGVLLGARLYRCDTLVRILIGPLDKASFDRFLPGADGAQALAALLQLHCGAGMDYDVRLLLRADAIAPLRFGARLGVDSWLPGGASRDRDDARYLLQS
jgi:type VI secretion system protein ImpH